MEARIVGSVYTANVSNGSVTLIRHDNEGAKYTAVAPGAPVVTPLNLLLPPPLAADRLVWLSADSGVTADGAGKVSNWTNQGGNAAFSVAQANVTKRPTLIANAINGKPAIRFVNSQSWLEASGMSTNGDDFIGPLTVFAVFTSAEVNNGKAVVTGFSTSDNYGNGDAFLLSNRVESIGELDNGVILGNQNVNLAKRLQLLVVGNTNNDYGFGLTGDIAEVLIYKGLSPLKAAQVQLYLNDKYKIIRKSALVNGDFEHPAVTGYLYTPGPVATESRGTRGWFFANYAVVQANGSAWNAPIAPSGIQTAVLQGADGQLGSMSQMVHLSAGSYTLGFKGARRSGEIQPVKVSVDQLQIGSLITPVGNSFTDFVTNTFTVADGQHMIRLEATDGVGNKSTFIDQVVLTKIVAPTSPQSGNFFTALYSGSRNDFTGNVGYEFTPSANITVTALGRSVSGTMANNHAIKIWRVSDQNIVATATVAPSSATDSLGYKYVSLPSSVTLSSGTAYRITTNETSGGDSWFNAASISNHSSTAVVNQAIWASGDAYPLNIGLSGENGYGVPTFYTGTASPFIAGHIYAITAKRSGKALEVYGGVTATGNGANVDQWAYVGGLHQQWMAEDAGGGAWRLTPQHSLKSLDVNGGVGATSDGVNIDQWEYIGTDNEKWLLESLGDGYTKVTAKHSGKVMEVVSGSTADGANVAQATYTGGDNQKWQFTDLSLGSLNASIGTVNPVGSGTLSGAGVYTIKGSGLGITGTSDKGHLYYDKLTGNGSIVAKVLSVQNTNASAKAGIMIRETTATGSKNVFLAFTPNGTVNFQRRTALNGTTTNTTAVAAIPSWIKLTRVGNTFQAYRSTNGTIWVAVGAAATVAMTSDVLIGLGVSSNTSTTACTATFSNVTLTGAITRL